MYRQLHGALLATDLSVLFALLAALTPTGILPGFLFLTAGALSIALPLHILGFLVVERIEFLGESADVGLSFASAGVTGVMIYSVLAQIGVEFAVLFAVTGVVAFFLLVAVSTVEKRREERGSAAATEGDADQQT